MEFSQLPDGLYVVLGALIGAGSALLSQILTGRSSQQQHDRQEAVRKRQMGEAAAGEILEALDRVSEQFSYRRESQRAKEQDWPANLPTRFRGPGQDEIEPFYQLVRRRAIDIGEDEVRLTAERVAEVLYYYGDVLDLRNLHAAQLASKVHQEARAVLGAYRRSEGTTPSHPEIDGFHAAHEERQEMYKVEFSEALEMDRALEREDSAGGKDRGGARPEE